MTTKIEKKLTFEKNKYQYQPDLHSATMNMETSNFLYEWHCLLCNHRWESYSSLETCPDCKGQGKQDVESLLQLSQRCAICNNMLLQGEETQLYNGPNGLFKDWICHSECCAIYNQKP